MHSNTSSNTPRVEIMNSRNVRKCNFSWSAVFVGALFGIGLSFLFNLFGYSVGLTAFTKTSPQTLTFFGVFGLVCIAILSMGMMGLVSGYLGATSTLIDKSRVESCPGCIYGFSAWCLALIISIMLATPTSHFIANSVHEINPSVVAEMTLSNNPNTPVLIDPVNTDQTTVAKTLASTSFIAFLLFFVGAISATIGGYCGYKNYIHDDEI